MLKAVIFDMDGTLLDSEVVHYIVIHDLIRQILGYDQPMEEYLQYCGTPDAQMWPAILQNLDGRFPGKTAEAPKEKLRPCMDNVCGLENGENAETLKEKQLLSENAAKPFGCAAPETLCAALERLHWEKFEAYIDQNGISPFPGVPELFAALAEAGVKIGIATGSIRKIVKKNLQRMGIERFVDAIAASEDCENGKPAPDIFLAAAGDLGVDPAACLVVEDARNGLLGAKRAGMAIVGFCGSAFPSETGLAPAVFSDYREMTPQRFFEWYEEQSQ